MQAGDELPELRVTPDRYLTIRYAGASGDFNPIHVDDDFARQVGLPGRILHGLYSMALVARAHTGPGGGPQSLRNLSVQFRGMGVPEREIVVRTTVDAVTDGVARTTTGAEQDGTHIIKRASGEITLR